MNSKILVVRLLGLLTIAILASNVEATNNVGAPGLAAALASIPLPDQAAWDDLGTELRHVREADIFDSSRDLDSVGSQLGRLSGALFLDDRRLLIADGMNAELHLVDLPARQAVAIGRRGEGPGEFRLLTDVRRTVDGFAVWDLMSARLTRFSLTGDVLDTWSYNPAWFNRPNAAPVAFLSDGAIIFRDGEEAANRHGLFREKIQYKRVETNGITNIVANAQGSEYWGHENGFEAVVLGHRLMEAQMDDQVVILQTDLETVRMLDRFGRIIDELAMGTGKKASASQVEMLRESRRDELRNRMERDRRRGSELFAKLAEASLNRVHDVPVNKTSPAVDDLFVDLDGRIWLRFYVMPDDDHSRWQVWNRGASSQAQFVVVVPRAWRLHDASGIHVVLSERDAVGRERVMVGVVAGQDR